MTAEQTPLAGRTVAFLATDGVEELEYTQPRQAAEQAGAQVELVSLKPDPIQSMRHDIEPSNTYPVDRIVRETDPAAYDALVLPGGAVNSDRLRIDPDAVNFVRAFFEQEKPVAAICHSPWIMVEAGLVARRTLTSYASLRTDITNAGGNWVDEPVHVENGVVTSRSAHDLSAFCAKMVEEISEGRHVGRMMPTR